MGGSSDFWQVRRNRVSKTQDDRWRERRERREREVSRHAPLPVTVALVADRDRLFDVYLQMKAEGGEGPGSDGVTYADLSNAEAARLLGDLSKCVLDGSYRPRPPRRVEIPKPGSSSRRVLRLGSILDRTLAKSLLLAMEPHAEKVFLPCSWAYRPGRSSWGMLRAIEREVVATGRGVIVNADIRTAFDCVPVRGVVDRHEELIGAWPGSGDAERRSAETARLLALVGTVLGEEGGGGAGIPQGNPYSPLCLNLVLTHWLDVPMTASMSTPVWHRYADNLVRLCRTVTEGNQVIRQIRRCLAPLGMVLKDDSDVFDLRAGDVTELLGFTLRLGDEGVAYGLGPGAVDHLRENLTDAHQDRHPTEAAKWILAGWMQSCGPALENDADVLGRIACALSSLGFRHLGDRKALERQAREARNGWKTFLHGNATHPDA